MPPAPEQSVPGGGEPQARPLDLKAAKRLVIYTASFAILVANVEDSMKELLAKINGWGGYIQSSDLKSVTFRVPAQNFDSVTDEISKMGVVTNKQIHAEDVTKQYRDLELRLQVAEASRKRMMDLLAKATATKDIIEIEKEIRRLTEEIEQIQASLRSMGDQILYSTITVTLTSKAPEPTIQNRQRRRTSYFEWINQIGAENVLNHFSR